MVQTVFQYSLYLDAINADAEWMRILEMGDKAGPIQLSLRTD